MVVHNDCAKPKKPKRVGENQMKKGKAHKLKTETLKDVDVKDKNISHYDIYQDVADNGRLWLNYNDNKSIWIDTFEYFDDIFRRK